MRKCYTINLINLILIFICFLLLFSCTTKIKSEFGPLDSMIGNTYYNCKVIKLKRIETETTMTCLYNDEELVMNIYTSELSDEQIRDEFLDILESNEHNMYLIY